MSFAIAAFTFGLAAGLNPGPLGVFVIHQTMSKGYRSGFWASLIPFLTDLPIGLVVISFTLQLGESPWFVAAISFLGSIYLARLAFRIFNSPGSVDPSNGEYDDGMAQIEPEPNEGTVDIPSTQSNQQVDSSNRASSMQILDWQSGLKMNFLNPVPYIFWGTVGSVYIIEGTVVESGIFIICMLVTLSITKFFVAALIRVLGRRFSPSFYSGILRSLSVPMILYSGKLMLSAISAL